MGKMVEFEKSGVKVRGYISTPKWGGPG
ncbi:MAG TPA: dienelactone hydrolase family protein, partial [Aquifex aeolicus]|nr:dienelactone hydrolase family protein [Aquifex aeolicus]